MTTSQARVDCDLHPNILPNVGNELKVLELINHIETGRERVDTSR